MQSRPAAKAQLCQHDLQFGGKLRRARIRVATRFRRALDTRIPPNWIVIPVRKSSDFERGYNEPGKMQIHTYPCHAKNWKSAFHC